VRTTTQQKNVRAAHATDKITNTFKCTPLYRSGRKLAAFARLYGDGNEYTGWSASFEATVLFNVAIELTLPFKCYEREGIEAGLAVTTLRCGSAIPIQTGLKS